MKNLTLFILPLLMANTFGVIGQKNDFKIVIDAKKVYYTSDTQSVLVSIQECNMPLVRALNAELTALIPVKDAKDGIRFEADGNSYHIVPGSKEATTLLNMDKRIGKFKAEVDNLCK